MGDRGYLEEVLRLGAEKARRISVPVLEQVRAAVGTGR
jgi:hypothetical protein